MQVNRGARTQSSAQRIEGGMNTVKIVYWKDGKHWLGYLQEYPDYRTQGKTLKQLKEMLNDLYRDITSGEIPGIRKVDDLVVS
jgi:hypothetical protein